MSQEPSTAKLAQDYADEHAPLFGMDAIAYGVLGVLASLFNLSCSRFFPAPVFSIRTLSLFAWPWLLAFSCRYAIVQHRKNTHLRLLREELERQKLSPGITTKTVLL